MGAVTRITAMGTLVVFGFLKGFQPIADVISFIITIFMALHIYKEITVAENQIVLKETSK